ncbi:transposase domain-containing protein [Mesorhizobium salmacidum]|uniref:Transposase domain-containing protein n=1 Tax=Mesorhizobium salmacidum TaxID=3015171 RepID=A0ABU8KWK8_9HYPH
MPDQKKCPVCRSRSRGENWALLASIVATCRLNDVNHVAYLAETLDAIINCHPQTQIEELMPGSENVKPKSIGDPRGAYAVPLATALWRARSRAASSSPSYTT